MQGDDQSGSQVVVRYASQDGSTREIAEHIAARIGRHGLAVAVSAVEAPDALPDTAAVVLGSAIHNGRWLEAADAFVATERDSLAAASLWLFSVSSFGDTNWRMKRVLRGVPKTIGKLRAELAPRDVRVFAGVVRADHWPWWARAFLRLFGGHVGDNRSWPVIDAWADEIARTVLAERA